MGQVVFNTRICDHAEWCPAITACERLLGVDKNRAPIYYDSTKKKVMLDGERCLSMDCIAQACTRQCQYFIYVDSPAEKWFLEQEFMKYDENPNFYFIPRFNAGGCPKHISISFRDLLKLIEVNSGLLIVEITNPRSCVGLFEGVKYSDLISENIYNRYFKKLFIEDLDDLLKIEERFGFSELPIILIFNKNKCVDKIVGIVKNNEPERVNELKNRLQVAIHRVITNYIG